MRLFLQSDKIPFWMGAVQVQFTNSLIYVSVYNTIALSLTFWYAAGYQMAQEYAPWFSLWLYLTVLVACFAVTLFIDYKFMFPARIKYVNEQTCRHENPAMDKLREIENQLDRQHQDIQKIKRTLGVKEWPGR